jgi:hypothetical protein
MLDYYGSIIKSEKEIDEELIRKFKDKCYESYMKNIIHDLRKQEVLKNEYSVSGWNVFHGKSIIEFINEKINHQKQNNEKKLKFIYSYIHSDYYNNDLCQLICDKIR